MTMQQYCLRWNNHQPNFISVFSSLLNSESLVDVTLAAEGRHLQAHKVVLSACSSYFQSLFTINPCQHPIVILKDVKFADLKVMVDFMYYGEVNVSQEQLPHILKTAEMLKIKGLAEIPVDQSVAKAQNSSSDKAELLTPGDSNWSTDGGPRQSLSPSPCPLSPSSKRKRLRKSSTGSGSGSTERTSDDHQSSEVTLTSSTGSVLGTVIKSDPGGYASDSSSILQKTKQHSSDSELQRGSSHESVEGEMHHVTLQVPQEVSVQHSLESTPSSVEVAGPSSSNTSQLTLTEKLPISSAITTSTTTTVTTTQAQFSSQQQQQRTQQLVMGTKRGRFLMRQPRIKRESDTSQASDNEPLSPQYLTVPPVKVERQCSEPLPAVSPPPGNLLTVPGAVLVKQHSHPLLPSQIHKSISPPLHIQLVPQQSIECTGGAVVTATTTTIAERAISPLPVVSDPLAVSTCEIPLKADSVTILSTSTTTLRPKSDELKRSASSPQTGTSSRSSHCPVVRPGPALGCNYCWNTVDNHGRILRRKTKYHCPECHTNLCIVPCFQEYHERHVSSGNNNNNNNNGNSSSNSGGNNTNQTDPVALTTSVMRVFPKTTSM